jgi:hypothetical protein
MPRTSTGVFLLLARVETPDRHTQGGNKQDDRGNSPWKARHSIPFIGRYLHRRWDRNFRFLVRCFRSRRSQVIGDGLFFIQAKVAGVGTNEALVEDAAGKLIEVILLNRA